LITRFDEAKFSKSGAGTFSQELEVFVGAKIYCPHALADGNQRIRIREKMLEFSPTVYLHCLRTFIYR